MIFKSESLLKADLNSKFSDGGGGALGAQMEPWKGRHLTKAVLGHILAIFSRHI